MPPRARKSGVIIDDSELHQLELDLAGAPRRMRWNVGAAVRKGARLFDREMRRDAKGHQGNYFGKPGTEFTTPLDNHVSHEMLSPLEAEIGIESRGAGKVAHIIVFGSVKNEPVYDHMAGPRRVLPKVANDIGDALEDSVLGND